MGSGHKDRSGELHGKPGQDVKPVLTGGLFEPHFHFED
jgi:hypothetical protein